MRLTALRLDRVAFEDPLLVAKSLQALARRRSVNRGAWQGHLQRALQVVKHADAQCAARVLNACSRSPVQDLANEVADAYQDRAKRLLGQSNVRQLATAANAMARMLIRDEDYILRLSRELRMKFQKCNTFQASLIANSYARLMVVERTLFGQLLPAFAVANGQHFRVKDLALVMHAYAKAQLRSTAVFDALRHRCREQTEHMDCQALSVIAAAHAKLLISDEPLFQALAWRLRSCARTCTFQAVSNLANAYAKFGFERPPMAPEGSTPMFASSSGPRGPRPPRSTVGVTEAVFDLVMEELPRLVNDSNAQSIVLLSHAAARAGQHRRWGPQLAERLAPLAQREMGSCDGAQLGMMAVAFAELWPLEDSSKGFWLALLEAAAAAPLGASDAANCGVAFAAVQLPAEQLARLELCRFSEDSAAGGLSPQCACALTLAHAYGGLWAPQFLQALENQVPELLWQATDSVASRWALSFVLAGQRALPLELRSAVRQQVLRQAKASEKEELDDASLIAACQGAAALLMPEVTVIESDQPGMQQIAWWEILRPPPCAPRLAAACVRDEDAEELRAAAQRLGEALRRRRARLGSLLLRLAAPRTTRAGAPLSPARFAGLSSLLLPSVKQTATEAPARTLEARKRLRRWLKRSFLRPQEMGHDLVVVLLVPEEVHVVFILDDQTTFMYPGEPCAAGERLHPDAELHGWLLAKEGYVVLRVRCELLAELLQEDPGDAAGAPSREEGRRDSRV
ncbi:Hypothetical protein (Fragment) [Durusdinium trenchii]|uniref:RNA-editing substrate-binding complex 6 protein domain-containing protein n=1 Tax=Durusdinium trenchii TaxID=1381693 RepID=A0ABP0RHI2_9DINO